MACPHCGSPHPKETKICPLTGLAMAAKRPGSLSPGELLDGKYHITREIGRGAMGVVYEAMHTALGRRVAVKTLLEEMSANAQLGERFQREARAASAIGHPNIIDVFDLGRTQDGLLFMVMEMLDGESLADTLKRTPQLPIPLGIHLMAQVLSGLSAAHKSGIVHRDLKPDNIFVLDSEERPNFVKIVDFGISKVLIPLVPGGAATAKGSGTMVGSILGTPLYMSPEQAIGQVAAIDHRADIYSAGVVLYEMLCGRTPFVGEGYAQILGGLLEGKYPPPRSLRPEISPALEAAIVRALDRDIENRFPSAAAMRDAVSGGSAEVTPSPIMLSASVGDPLRISLADPDGGPAQGSASIALLPKPAPTVGSEHRCATVSADPFAPPPESEASPLLADDLDMPLAVRPSPGRRPATEPREEPRERVREIAIDESARPRAGARGKPTMAPERLLSSRARSRLAMALSLLALAVGARLAYTYLRPAADGGPALRRGANTKVHLTVEPSLASVQIDHIPTTQRALDLDSGAPHVLNAAAPGRVTRRFAFEAKPGLRLSLHLRHTLPLPVPTDPPPLPAELAADYPDNPRPQPEVEHGFAKLDRYADCLAMAGDAIAEGKKSAGRGRLRGEELALCQRLVSEAGTAEPTMSELQSAAESYLAAAQGGQKLDAIGRLAATFRAEFLAARTAWQLEELSRQGQDEGQKAAWHMRRVALAAQAWLRAHKSQGQVGDERAAKLREYHEALLDDNRSAGPEFARITGASDFMLTAENVAQLARGKKASEFAALDAVRRLLSAFNALVVD